MNADTSAFTGLREAHCHIAEHGAELLAVRLTDCAGAEECLERIAEASRALPPDEWVVAVGARVEAWADPTWPSAARIHRAAGGRPCILRSLDLHSLAASEAALKIAGVMRDTPDPPEGAIERDARTGEPTGVMLERACELIYKAQPPVTPAQRREHVRIALEDFARLGFVEVHDMLSRDWLGPILRDLKRTGELPVRVVLHPLVEDLAAEVERKGAYECDEIRVGGGKLFADGALNSRTAWMLKPYAQPRRGLPNGMARVTPDDLDRAIATCEAHGLPLVAHAIGDAAVRALLDAIERNRRSAPGYRIEHCQFVDPQDTPRFAQLGVIASMQPCHLLADIEPIRRLLPDREHTAFPVRALIDAAQAAGHNPATLVWFGSDAPVVPPDPADNVQAAVHRTRAGANAPEPVAPEQAISKEQALACMRA